jgi:hypothetical protein
MSAEWKASSFSEFDKAKKKIYNRESYYVNEERWIIVKNKDVLKVLSVYKIQTYEGNTHRVHFKDIYQKLIKKVFMDELDDFEISKYLKTKIKNQWLEKHKKMKDLPKTGFKAHQGFASSIISNHARQHRFKQAAEPPGKDADPHFANDGCEGAERERDRPAHPKTRGLAVTRDPATARKIKIGSKKAFRIGFSDFVDENVGKEASGFRKGPRATLDSHNHGIDLDSPRASREEEFDLPDPRGANSQGNKDSNPQEYEEGAGAPDRKGRTQFDKSMTWYGRQVPGEAGEMEGRSPYYLQEKRDDESDYQGGLGIENSIAGSVDHSLLRNQQLETQSLRIEKSRPSIG